MAGFSFFRLSTFRLRAIYAALWVPALVALSACSGGYRHEEGLIWNTVYHITYKGPAALSDSILPVLRQVSESVSVFEPASVVSRVNSSLEAPVDSIFIKVYRASRLINSHSGRCFDPTLSPLITAWGFGQGHKCSADTARTDSMLAFTGIEKTFLRGKTLVKADVRTQFNFSAIAKGLGCDAVGDMFRRNGVKDFLVEIGGEVVASGVSPSGGGWRVSIDRPEEDTGSGAHPSQAVIVISGCGVASSGNYRNFHVIDGKKAGHTIDRFTGRPAITDMAGATVVAPDCMTADGYATACMAMGMDRAKSMVVSHDLAAMLIGHDGEVWVSPAFRKYLEKSN